MDRRLLHKVALVGGALVVIGGAIVVLRNPDSGRSTEPPPPQPAQTEVKSYADKAVLVPHPGERPKPPQRLDIRASAHRLVIGWGPARIDAPAPAGAVGYEVRWGRDGRRLVVEPVIQLDGLDNDVPHRIEVRTVDAYGQRSEPAVGQGTPVADPPEATQFALLDRFDGPVVPDPARWRLVGTGNCTKAARGAGEDKHRLVITGQCGASDEGIALRSRTPLRLAGAASGELGRVTVRTDRPGEDGELTIDLVPGPVDLIGRAPSGTLGPVRPGLAVDDDSLPPGTIRVRISAWPHGVVGPDDDPATVIQVLVAPGTPRSGKPIELRSVPRPELSVSVRWDVILRTDGVYVERDGVVVGGGDVVPSFTEATPLIGFGGQGGIRASIDMIGLGGAPVATPPLVPAPRVDFEREVGWPGAPAQTTDAGRPLTGVQSGQLRITLVPQANLSPDSGFTVDIAGRSIPARRAVEGQPALATVRLPIVADLPPEALKVNSADAIPVVVRATREQNGLATQVLTASLELSGSAPAPPKTSLDAPLARPNAALAVPTATLHDAAGAPIPALQEVPRGRMVLDVVLDPLAAQRNSGSVAGLAGFEISIDSRPLAGVPTVVDGPGIGGTYRIALDTNELSPGGHNIQVLAIPTDAATSFAITYAPFVLR